MEEKNKYINDRKQEVVFNQQEILAIDCENVKAIIENAQQTQRKRSRLCTHLNEEDLLHEMILVLDQQNYIHPHKHPGKSESFHIIYGAVDLIFFEDDGTLKQILQMGDYHSGLNFYYRMSSSYYHTLVIRSDWLVVHETTNGPFLVGETVYAPWAPDEGTEEVPVFLNQLQNTLKEFH